MIAACKVTGRRVRRTKRPGVDIRREAAAMAREDARDRERDGDPEGAGVLRDLAARIARIRLTEDVR